MKYKLWYVWYIWCICFSEGCTFHVISLKSNTMTEETVPAAKLSPPNTVVSSLLFIYVCYFFVQIHNSVVALGFKYGVNYSLSEFLISKALECHCTSQSRIWRVLWKKLHFLPPCNLSLEGKRIHKSFCCCSFFFNVIWDGLLYQILR